MKTIKILYMEDNPDDANLIQTIIKRVGLNWDIYWVDSKEKFEHELMSTDFDLVLADYTIPNYNGLGALQFSKEKKPSIPFIVISGTIGEEKTIELFQQGVTDFITKSNLERIIPAIKRALNEVEEREKRLIAEKELKKNELLFRQFTESVPEVFWQTTPNFDEVIYASPAFETVWGITVDELYKKPLLWFDSIVPEDQLKVKEKFFKMADENISNAEVQFKILRPDGQIRIILSRATLLKDESSKIIGILGIDIDVTEHEGMNEKIKDSLLEKEAMLKEIYHRVKNNLQVVSSLLNLQAKTITDPTAKQIFIESSMRIKSMALVHELLYSSGDLALIEMAEYVEKLSSNLRVIYHAKSSQIKVDIDVDSVRLNINSAIPCGLIINELMTNAFKYAFPDGKAGEIHISMKGKDNLISLTLSDNGVGLPSSLDFKKTSTLGMQLIHSLTKQLTGDVVLDRMNGTKFTVTFPTKQSVLDKETTSYEHEYFNSRG